MSLASLKAVVAAYHGKVTADLTVNSVDLFLIAANNARKAGERLHNFEATRVSATLDVDGVTGGSLADAVIDGDIADVVTITGVMTPNIVGTYTRTGSFNGYPMYLRIVGVDSYFIYYNEAVGSYIISSILSSSDPASFWNPVVAQNTVPGTYVAEGGGITGSATAALTSPVFNGLKEVVTVSTLRTNGVYLPMNFSRADMVNEQERGLLELDNTYHDDRYPSDATFLAGQSDVTVVQRGGSIFFYPRTATTDGAAVPLTIEGFAWLSDYTATDLLSSEPKDFFLLHGFDFLQWATIIELNYLFKSFVPRQEGNLSSPENQKAEAWRNLVIWDSYSVDSHTTRAR